MNEKFKNVQKRALQYWFIDGLAEMAAGLIGILLAVLFWIWEVVFTWRWSLPVILIVALAVSFGLRLIIQGIKARMTYPLTGYIAPFSGFESKWSVAAIIVFALILIIMNYILSISVQGGIQWSPGVAGLIFFIIFLWVGISTSLKRFYFLALLSMIVGMNLILLETHYLRGVSILTGIVGFILLIQGFLIRKKYLVENPHKGKVINE